nr:MAG TPA: hypothetical protein [Caudoviricetes sp.]
MQFLVRYDNINIVKRHKGLQLHFWQHTFII